jgi:hypothetical protein
MIGSMLAPLLLATGNACAGGDEVDRRGLPVEMIIGMDKQPVGQRPTT